MLRSGGPFRPKGTIYFRKKNHSTLGTANKKMKQILLFADIIICRFPFQPTYDDKIIVLSLSHGMVAHFREDPF